MVRPLNPVQSAEYTLNFCMLPFTICKIRLYPTEKLANSCTKSLPWVKAKIKISPLLCQCRNSKAAWWIQDGEIFLALPYAQCISMRKVDFEPFWEAGVAIRSVQESGRGLPYSFPTPWLKTVCFSENEKGGLSLIGAGVPDRPKTCAEPSKILCILQQNYIG